MFNPNTFKLAPLPSWQYPYRLMFSQERGKVNIPYEKLPKELFILWHWGIPQGTKTPEDWDRLFDIYHLAISDRSGLNVDAGTREEGSNIVSSFNGMEERTLFQCFVIAFFEYWCEHGNKHHKKLHPSWYGIVETCAS